MMPPRRIGNAWPRVLCPWPGCLPPTVGVRGAERVLHIADRRPDDAHDEVGAALGLLTDAPTPEHYRQVSVGLDSLVDADALEAAADIRPTVIVMHPQRESLIAPEVVGELRELSDPSCVIVQWTGDQHYEPADAAQRWFVDLGRVCDTSLVVNTRHPYEYAELGVQHPGFLEVGIDETLWRPAAPTPGTPAIVCLANAYAQFDYRTRDQAFAAVHAAFPGEFAVYGQGWEGGSLPWRPFVQPDDTPGIYSAARAVLSISIRADLPRYTSNRLLYALGCGAVVLVERFPDLEGLGLEPGVNCLLWEGVSGLLDEVQHVLCTRPEDWLALRAAARELALGAHTWRVRMGELQAIVDAVRSDR